MDPTKLLQKWLGEYKALGVYEPEAAVLSTFSEQEGSSSRVVLIRQITDAGLIFFTNTRSKKALDISLNPNVAIHFYFRELYRQVQIRGEAQLVNSDIANSYFAQRSKDKQISAWVSKQSQLLEDEQKFVSELKEFEVIFHNQELKRPDFWSGYIVEPHYFEFWNEGEARRHHRLCYRKTSGEEWNIFRLYP